MTLKANSSTGNVYDGAEKSAKGVEADRFVIDGVEYAVSGYLTQDPAETAAGTYTNNVTGDFKVEDPAGNNVTSEIAARSYARVWKRHQDLRRNGTGASRCDSGRRRFRRY